jgi:hypothetical protein
MRTTTKRAVSLMASASLAAVIIGAASAGEERDQTKVIHTSYDGVSNDLLTAGLGKTGLGSRASQTRCTRRRKNCGAPRSTTTIAHSSTPRRAAAMARFTGQTSSRTEP